MAKIPSLEKGKITCLSNRIAFTFQNQKNGKIKVKLKMNKLLIETVFTVRLNSLFLVSTETEKSPRVENGYLF